MGAVRPCIWCDDPVESGDLCAPCRAVHDLPLFYCTVPGHTIPTRGSRCAKCERVAYGEALRREANAAQIATLQDILDLHLAKWREPWPGMEFGKAMLGNAIVGAIRDLGGEPRFNTAPVDLMARLLMEDPEEYQRRASLTPKVEDTMPKALDVLFRHREASGIFETIEGTLQGAYGEEVAADHKDYQDRVIRRVERFRGAGRRSENKTAQADIKARLAYLAEKAGLSHFPQDTALLTCCDATLARLRLAADVQGLKVFKCQYNWTYCNALAARLLERMT